MQNPKIKSLLLLPGLSLLAIVSLTLVGGLNPAQAKTYATPNLDVNQDTATATRTASPAPAATIAPTGYPGPAETIAPKPSATDANPTVASYERPLIVVDSYSASQDTISPGSQFELRVRLSNHGQGIANNVVAQFTGGDLIPLGTGGSIAVGEIAPGNHGHVSQDLSVSSSTYGKDFVSIDMVVNYIGDSGTAYSDKFTITLPLYTPSSVYATSTPTPTPTAAPILRPQLVIGSYTEDVPVLQPGMQFKLELNVVNAGNADAKRVTMIFGGGSTTGGDTGGTPVSGGTSGGSGDLTNFAPLGSSNIQSLGDLAAGAGLTARQSLIVNVNTNPGAYSMKVSFSYLDERGHNFTDDQVITLLVYSIPQVGVEFYRDPGPIYANQTIQLPIQIVNQGRKSTILGNMRVTAENATLNNNTVLVGSLDPGNYFPLDAMLIPNRPGPLTLTVNVDYTDDFNQPQKITKTLQVTVLEAPVVEPGINGPGMDGGKPLTPVSVPETFIEKVWRFLRGLIGLDSGLSTQTLPAGSNGNPEGTSGGSGAPIKVVPAGRPLKGP